jgi:O-antigen biosynthesis protein
MTRMRAVPHAPAITTVIPTIGRSPGLSRLVQGLLDEAGPPSEVVVVHNGPDADATRRLVELAAGEDGRVRVLIERQRGSSRARNRGLAAARSPLIAFLDDDVAIRPGWLAAIVDAFDAAPDVGCVTGLIEPLELATTEQRWLEEYGGYGKGTERRIFDLVTNRPPDPLFPYTAGAFGSGANMAFRADALREVGGFDTALGGGTPARGGEDLAAFTSVVAAGHALVYEPRAVVRHPHHRSRARLRRQVLGYGMGLSACLTKLAADDWSRLADIGRRVPGGVRFLLAPSSPKNRRKSATYPRELTVLELAGFAIGPFAYALGRRPRTGATAASVAGPVRG